MSLTIKMRNGSTITFTGNSGACLKSTILLGVNDMKKCIVLGCENERGQGSFRGDLCYPCYHMLTTGELSHTNSFLGQYVGALDKIKNLKVFWNKIHEIVNEENKDEE